MPSLVPILDIGPELFQNLSGYVCFDVGLELFGGISRSALVNMVRQRRRGS